MKVLVTGSCGFIGTNLCLSLLKKGHSVLGIDDFSGEYPKKTYNNNISSLKNYKNFSFVKGDITSNKTILSLSRKKIDCIVHLAAKTGVRDSVEHPKKYFLVNVLGTQNILDLAVKHKIKKVVLASTSSVYGKNSPPFKETMAINIPLSPYSASKFAMEALAYSYYNVFKQPITVLRFFTVYGPRGRHDMAVYKFSKLVSEGKPITIFGDGSAERDFTYIDDVIEGINSAMNLKKGFNVFNIGDSRKIKLNELIVLLEKNLGKTAIKVFVNSKSEDASRTLADITNARKFLGYNPKVKIHEGIKLFVNWFKNDN